MQRNIWEAAAFPVVVLRIVVFGLRVHSVLDISTHDLILPARPLEVSAESAGAALPRGLGRDGDEAANGGEVWARRGIDGVKNNGFEVWCETAGADTDVAGGEDGGYPAEGEEAEEVAGEDGVVFGDTLE